MANDSLRNQIAMIIVKHLGENYKLRKATLAAEEILKIIPKQESNWSDDLRPEVDSYGQLTGNYYRI